MTIEREIERDFERDERVLRQVDAYAFRDRMDSLAKFGVRVVYGPITTEARNSPDGSDAPGDAPAESFGSESVDLSGLLTEGEAE